ncbi:transcriptional regulator [Pyrococcus abyssi]|uniref:Transcriptional regulator n=1 Tax=Pyrococcus abyssi (strain GE5 / Orsay) TaxID=272844 RepID=Q9V067_PYRAB|nr:transcriptional regulator [Pyrococcus abyssi]CAB49838.1 Putative transcriptional regulator [Pyrococcus abyssi GE5]CCE70332.1 TPA: transcriptional regulator, ArsR family protein [Pyrococcus abyssi GE5]
MEELKQLMKSHILGNPVRLGIMVFLLSRRKATFSQIQKVLDLTPGNLKSHLNVLEKDKLIKTYKVIADRPRTVVEITDKGIQETRKFLKMLKGIIDSIEF